MPDTALDALLEGLAADRGNPGGGTAGGVITAIGAALGQMVARYSSDVAEAAGLNERLGSLRARAIAAAERDGEASGALGAALRPAEDGSEDDRDRRIVSAVTDAVQTSAELGRVALAVLSELTDLSTLGNRHLLADVAVALDAVAAGLGAAATNLRGGLTLAAAHGDARALHDAHDDLAQRLLDARREARTLAERLGEP
ncbi:cyclodeaminase/cyclohydrolase family protein [Microbacterium thalli]|uniref:Cyclodeaminase/cyclohydrolase family protein n=1 Tax=Microbacterium thalli TaxID=3027921 RepID=A0ABT5SHX8_9MICO|nr:cyclodeaminase/cyclohydrolase family protein [Microbacterium thalli]MDD7962404.1 cyclodeaminase/cyclohydrolase family protein [Microbacterium thalli]